MKNVSPLRGETFFIKKRAMKNAYTPGGGEMFFITDAASGQQ